MRPEDLLSVPCAALTSAGIRLPVTLERLLSAARLADTPTRCISSLSVHAKRLISACFSNVLSSPIPSLSFLSAEGVLSRQHRTVSVENVLRSSAKKLSSHVSVVGQSPGKAESDAERELLTLRKRLFGLREKVPINLNYVGLLCSRTQCVISAGFDSQFAALADQLWDAPVLAADVRRRVVTWLRAHPNGSLLQGYVLNLLIVL